MNPSKTYIKKNKEITTFKNMLLAQCYFDGNFQKSNDDTSNLPPYLQIFCEILQSNYAKKNLIDIFVEVAEKVQTTCETKLSIIGSLSAPFYKESLAEICEIQISCHEHISEKSTSTSSHNLEQKTQITPEKSKLEQPPKEEKLYAMATDKMVYLDYKPMHIAAAFNLVEDLNRLLLLQQQTADGKKFRQIKNLNGSTPLHVAAEKGSLEVLKILIQSNKFNINAKDVDGKTPLILAVTNGHIEIVQHLLNNSNCNLQTNDHNNGWNALHFCISNGNLEIVKLLLQKNISVDQKGFKNGWTALHLAVMKGSLFWITHPTR